MRRMLLVLAVAAVMATTMVYFTDMEGARGGYIVLNMDDASQIPAIAEPFFIGLDATVHIHPVMTADDLGRAEPAIDQAAQRYG